MVRPPAVAATAKAGAPEDGGMDENSSLTDFGDDAPEEATAPSDDPTEAGSDDAGETAAESEEVVADHDDGRVTVEVPADLSVTCDRETLSLVLSSLVENAVERGVSGDGDGVSVTASETDGVVAISVADDGPGIPENELAVLDTGVETDLEHSTGLGLWLATWGTDRIGGELSVETGEDGTTATLTIQTQ